MSVPRSQASPAAAPPQVLDALLSHYQEGVQPTIRSHLSTLLQEFPGLRVKLEAFAQSDGRPPCLFLQVRGTIPISFLQVIYNIPVVIWLSDEYPSRAPLVFVTPSPSMIIKSAHPLVDASGFVSCPRLRSWVSPPSTLVDLARSLCVAFGHDPPVYSVTQSPSSPLPSSSLLSASPSASSTSALSTSVSLLGPGLSSQPHRPHANGTGLSIMPLPVASASMPASLLGPGSLSPHFSGAATSHHYFTPCVSSAWTSSAITPAGYPASVSSSRQHPPHVYGAVISMANLSASASLLGPGKMSQGNMVIPFPAPQSTTTMSSHSGLSNQGHSSSAYDVRLPVAHHLSPSSPASALTSMCTSVSLLGPGNFSQMHHSHNSKNYTPAHLSLPASLALTTGPSLSGPWCPPHTYAEGSLEQSHLLRTYANGSLVQWSPPLGAGACKALSPTASLLGAGSLSQWNALHAHVGVPMVHPSEPSSSASTSSSWLALGTRLQQHPTVDHAHHAGEELHTSASSPSSINMVSLNSASLISMPQNAGPPSTSLQQHSVSPAQNVQFLNPIFGSPSPPPDSRQSVIDTLADRLQCDIDKIRMAREMDMLESMDMEGLLKQRQGFCDKSIQELQQHKESLELQLQTVHINTDVLESWLVANNKRDVNIDIDEVFEPCDGLSNQLRECLALDLAIEDALYCLDKAVEEGQLPMDNYLRYVKTLSREQFLHRANAIKVKAAQGQS